MITGPAIAPENLFIPINRFIAVTEVYCGTTYASTLQTVSTEAAVEEEQDDFLYHYQLKYTPTVSFINTKRHTIINDIAYSALINNYELPKEEVKSVGSDIFDFLTKKNIYIESITPLSEGGIGFEFMHDGTYYNIKVDNDLDAIFYKHTVSAIPEGWDLDFTGLIRKLTAEF